MLAANRLSLKQAQSLPNAPGITTTKGLRDRAIFAVLPAALFAGARWRRSPMGAVRADSRRRRRSPHGTRMRRSCRIVTRRIASAVSDRASSRALRALGAAGNGEWDARPECVSVSAGFAGQRGRCSLLSNRTGSGHEILSGNVRRLTA